MVEFVEYWLNSQCSFICQFRIRGGYKCRAAGVSYVGIGLRLSVNLHLIAFKVCKHSIKTKY